MNNKKKPLNPWAFVAIVCAVGMCPFFTIASILLGIRALVDIKARPGTGGVRLAWIAICLGSLVTGVWGGGLLWWNFNVRNQMQHGLVKAIVQGESNTLRFVEQFTQSHQDEAKEFLSSLEDRYGVLQSGEQIESTKVDGEELVFFLMPMQAVLNYKFQFTKAKNVQVSAQYVLFSTEGESRQFRNKFGWICLHDEVQGNLIYPHDAEITMEASTEQHE
ncbi:MAG: hypothetical protein QGI78_03760 [Phycisphaerales bacterium]|jgi:hypothetical protein|nr:hypothetical protein [Phycisphaerales bacterium]